MKKHVLLIDDSPDLQEVFRMALEQEGYEVSVVNNGQEGLNFFNTTPCPNIDAILCDYLMPIMDGKTFLEKIKSIDATKNIPFIIMTGDKPNLKHFPLANAVVEKPMDILVLYKTMEEQIK